ncbi:MAG: class B sortase [Oscillospiraceae bacterium]|nr:class B sortase [Oscillospiraceae bacterium]
MKSSRNARKSIALLLAGAALIGVLTSCQSEPEIPELEVIQLSVELPTDGNPLPRGTFTPPAEPVWTEHGGYSREVNDEFVGWISVGEGRSNQVDYPVVQKTLASYLAEGIPLSHFYYLNREFEPSKHHQHSDRGTIFVDRHTPIDGVQRPDNTVIYGHNMARNRVKFNFLVNYRYEFLDTYREFPTVHFATVYDEFDDPRNTYLIFAGMLAHTRDVDGPVFDYHRRRIFNEYCCWGYDNAKDNFFDFIGNVMNRSSFYTDVDIEFGDEFITLSTCDYPLGRDRVSSRFVLFARRLRPGESLDKFDFNAAYENPDPLYFDRWYADSRTPQSEWGGMTWDTALVRDFDEWLANNPDWDPQVPNICNFACDAPNCPRP